MTIKNIWTCLECGSRSKHVELQLGTKRAEFDGRVSARDIESYKWKCVKCKDQGIKTRFGD